MCSKEFHIDDLVMDRVLHGSDYACEVYEASRIEVVLGRSSNIEEEVVTGTCAQDRVPILRRKGGGGTVVLSPGTVILSIAGRSSLQYYLREHMNAVNTIIIDTLTQLGVESLSIRGISDIALGIKKILGSSLYRRKDLLLYQGSLLVDTDLTLMARYLRQPRKQPAYRKGRPHEDFMTSLYNEGYAIPKAVIIDRLKNAFTVISHWPPVLPENPLQ